MVTEGLNKIAITMGRKARETLEKDIVAADVAVAQRQADYDKLKREAEKASLETNTLYRERKNKLEWLEHMDRDLRELSRPRDGFPYLNDVEYEVRMHELRIVVQGTADEIERRAASAE